MARAGDNRGRGSRRGPAPATREELDRAALAYLDRFDSTADKLRRVLLARVDRSARAHGTDPDEGRRIVDELIERYRQSGLIDDVRFATVMARGLRARGGSTQAIRHKLRARGVPDWALDEALSAADVDAGREGELEAARTFARKRRLGPFRRPGERSGSARRDLAALGRAGFGPDIARAVLDLDGSDGDDE